MAAVGMLMAAVRVHLFHSQTDQRFSGSLVEGDRRVPVHTHMKWFTSGNLKVRNTYLSCLVSVTACLVHFYMPTVFVQS